MTAINASVDGPGAVAVTATATGENSAGTMSHGGVNGVHAEGGANGLFAKGKSWCGVVGLSESTTGGFGVWGENIAGGAGVGGKSSKWVGVYGETEGIENGPAGVWGEHKGAGIGVKAISNTGVGLIASSNGTAAIFMGDVEVTGDIRLNNADCAEDFSIGTEAKVAPGTPMVLGDDGRLLPSTRAYDKRVVGVVSGAGSYKPGIVLDKQPTGGMRQPIGLLGKVYVKASTCNGAIETGDLLTTSTVPGQAMKATDPARAFGAVIGKALGPLAQGEELIPILIALQ